MSDCVLSPPIPPPPRGIMRGGFTAFCPLMNRANSLNYKQFITNFELLYDLKSRQVALFGRRSGRSLWGGRRSQEG
ncbi:hypothetical protein QR680_009817 [Steinernema hermaphroditum]|uniref:Uncharacterized protein n=1 Tax=Steinernema hermaphroditum TaxID=289476 RepID=A0AA39MAM7_9BILA|nr:hypothetical protein QR680_009817 [Steinernema hermaphroditum]